MEKIRIYTMDSCPFCSEMKTLMIDDNIDFVEVNVDLPENEEEFNKITEVTQSSIVPTIKIGKQLLVPNQSFSTIKEGFEILKKLISEQ